jgi:hypothetical protein
MGAGFGGAISRAILVLIAPDRADADEMLVSGVCGRCAGSAGWPQTGWQERILALMAEPLRCLWLGSRFIDPARLAPAGTA